MVEALAAGVPAIVAPGVNLGADVESAGAGWVVSRDRTVWQHALAAVIADDHERRSRATRAREYAGRFRWSAVARPRGLRLLCAMQRSTRIAWCADAERVLQSMCGIAGAVFWSRPSEGRTAAAVVQRMTDALRTEARTAPVSSTAARSSATTGVRLRCSAIAVWRSST